MKSITIQQETNLKTGRFSKASFLNKIKKGDVKVFMNDDKYDMEYISVTSESVLKIKNGLRFYANYQNDKQEDLIAYLGTSFKYKFTY